MALLLALGNYMNTGTWWCTLYIDTLVRGCVHCTSTHRYVVVYTVHPHTGTWWRTLYIDTLVNRVSTCSLRMFLQSVSQSVGRLVSRFETCVSLQQLFDAVDWTSQRTSSSGV